MEEQGAAVAAARRCTAEVHGWHALGSCVLLSEEKLVRHRAAVCRQSGSSRGGCVLQLTFSSQLISVADCN